MSAFTMGLWCLNLTTAAVRAPAGGIQGPGALANEHLRAFWLELRRHTQRTLETSTISAAERNPDRLLHLSLAGQQRMLVFSLSAQKV